MLSLLYFSFRFQYIILHSSCDSRLRFFAFFSELKFLKSKRKTCSPGNASAHTFCFSCMARFTRNARGDIDINVINYATEYTTKIRVKKSLVLGNRCSVKLVLCEL